jgi:hypothetical protein
MYASLYVFMHVCVVCTGTVQLTKDATYKKLDVFDGRAYVFSVTSGSKTPHRVCTLHSFLRFHWVMVVLVCVCVCVCVYVVVVVIVVIVVVVVVVVVAFDSHWTTTQGVARITCARMKKNKSTCG